MTPLFEALTSLEDRDRILCLEGDRPVTRDETARAVARLAAGLENANGVLPRIAIPRIAIHCASARLFLVGLAAAWWRGAQVILPATDREGYLAEIAHTHDLYLDDQAIEERLETAEGPPWSGPRPTPETCLAVMFTSGSTGLPKEIRKTLAQLEAEITTQDPLWRDQAPLEARVLGLVSHQHIYGLLFRILWPVMGGRVFQARQARFWEDLISDARPGDIIVASPAHLGRPHADLVSMARPSLVFSSGGPLPLEASQASAAVLDAIPTEIYGSTETGGIAWRRQRELGAATPWTPLPGVAVALNEAGCLRVRAAHIAGEAWYQTEDRANLEGTNPEGNQTGFRLGGRADRVVKVEGKRLSLTAVERHLAASDLVDDVVALLASDDDTRLSAVVVPTAAGWEAHGAEGAFRLGRRLRHHLRAFEEDAALPHRWRFVETLPTDAQGKRPLALFRALFEDRTAIPPSHQPIIHAEQRKGTTVTLSLTIPEDLLYYQGHFDGYPLLPGIIQIHWVAERASASFGLSPTPTAMSRLKFHQPILPGAQITLSLTHDPAKGSVTFHYASDAGDHASGVLKWAEAA
ncbi:MAG: AMP-binding protein [Rhodospirillum sp.]|nr:AMP-binding protein [Rhodospirillum sp.]MCF8490840.1 AMP-binding protein [Rhodospirillum sp.]MCF8501399.1 AMP-binding protein [Rhodospirillum sp.]